jgi:DnaJ-class molecular chaperone
MKCRDCYGTGVTDNHVTGEVYCSACDGSGIDDEMIVVNVNDELHQILGEALSTLSPPTSGGGHGRS